MTRARSLLFGLMALGATAASAQVTGVVTHSEVAAHLKPGPGDTGIYNFQGVEIAGSLGSNKLGSGGAYASTSRLDPDGIEFQNGNASGGLFASMSSYTSVDITFKNDGSQAVVPTLHSSIVPAGFGLFVDRPCLDNVAACGAGHDLFGTARDLKQFTPGTFPSPSDALAGASFDFRISSGGVVMYDLTGSISLVRDALTGTNIIVTDFDAAQLALSGFRLTAPIGDSGEFGVAWDATDITVVFPDGTLLAPGESATLTYESTVQTYSHTPCFQGNIAACLVAYSSFGDPVGRGGGIRPTLDALSESSSVVALDSPVGSGLSFGSFTFQLPQFKDGVLDYPMIPQVVEPASWMMLIAGFGLVGFTLRRSAFGARRFA